jgi:hypothetical protein
MDHDLETVGATLEREGYYVGLRLEPQLLAALLRRARISPCFAERRPGEPLMIKDRVSEADALASGIKVASYFDQHERWPELRAILEDATFQAIGRRYLGAEPVYQRGELLWSFPQPASALDQLKNAQVLHCDINDYRTLKLFFYLTDVNLGAGPHTYVKKSPNARTLVHQALGQRCASIADETLIETYGRDQVVTICGPSGFGFIGDPYYFHRGTTPTQTTRLLLQLELGYRRYRRWYFS